MIASKQFECDLEPGQNAGKAKLASPNPTRPLQPAWLPLQIPRWNLNLFAPLAVFHWLKRAQPPASSGVAKNVTAAQWVCNCYAALSLRNRLTRFGCTPFIMKA